MRGFRPDNLASKRTTANAASGSIGSGANGVVTATDDVAGFAGNSKSIRAVAGVGLDVALSAAISGGAITVTLGTDGAGVLDDTKNTATLVTAEVDALSGVSAVASGSGATVVPVTAAVSFTGGHDVMTQNGLARAVGFPVKYLVGLEKGSNCEVHEAQRLASFLGCTLAQLGLAL